MNGNICSRIERSARQWNHDPQKELKHITHFFSRIVTLFIFSSLNHPLGYNLSKATFAIQCLCTYSLIPFTPFALTNKWTKL